MSHSDKKELYTTQLGAGLGLVEETKQLLQSYSKGMTVTEIHQNALDSGMFPNISARRLRNIIAECFAPRYIKPNVASYLKSAEGNVSSNTLIQLFLIHTCEANKILRDFITDVFWHKYLSGRNFLTLDDAREFVTQAVRESRTQTAWSESMQSRVSSYLLGVCADYGLLASHRGAMREIQPIRITEQTSLYLAYWLHFQQLGDNSVMSHPAWQVLGLERSDVKDEFKKLAKNGWLIVQSAGDVTRISWHFKSMEEVIDVITQG